jgi:uroporphyrinogen-III decarboxylase
VPAAVNRCRTPRSGSCAGLGRSLPGYKGVRDGTAMLDSCTRPEPATEITLLPVRRGRDSWVGMVSPEDYRHAILPHTSRIFSALAATGLKRGP